jgi:Fe-S cluster biogenesis protein NfuA
MAERGSDDRWDAGSPPATTVHWRSRPPLPGARSAEVAGTPASPVPGNGEDNSATRLAELRDLIELMRPAVQADGGDLVLVSADVTAGVVEVQLQGACSSCAISASTLKAGVERILRQRLPWVREVRGGVDEEEDFLASAARGRGGWVPKV